jgi:hypothetical protein
MNVSVIIVMSPLFSTVGKLAYGLVTNWYGLISQKPWIFISVATKYQQISDFIATRRRKDSIIWVCYRLDYEELPDSRQKKEEATVLVVGPLSLHFNWCQSYFTRFKVAGARSSSHTPSSAKVKNEWYCYYFHCHLSLPNVHEKN